jgi:predicted nucleic acid-binding protein
MIRAVVDTNIFIRAIIRPRGTVAPMLTRLQEGAYELIVSDPLLDELLGIEIAGPRAFLEQLGT